MLKKALLISAATFLVIGNIISAETKPATAPTEEISKADILRVSEAFGHFIGRNIKSPGIQLDIDSIIKGMRDGAAGKPAPMNDKDYEALMMKVQESAFKKLSSENLSAANAFMEKNAKDSNVKIIEANKLQYTTLKPGDGAVVMEHFSPQIEYTGKYIDGTVFGSSTDTGGPITIPLDQTIPGFSKGIIGMKENEERRLFVHPELGYGTSGHLAPNSLLIFDVKVVKANAPSDDDKDMAGEDGSDDDGTIEMDDIEVDDSKSR